jgi:hypothetical protein
MYNHTPLFLSSLVFCLFFCAAVYGWVALLLALIMMVVCVERQGTWRVWSGTECRYHLIITSASLLSVFACSIDDVVVRRRRRD